MFAAAHTVQLPLSSPLSMALLGPEAGLLPESVEDVRLSVPEAWSSALSMAPPSLPVLPVNVEVVTETVPDPSSPLSMAPPSVPELPVKVDETTERAPVPPSPLSMAPPWLAELAAKVDAVTVTVPPALLAIAPPRPPRMLSECCTVMPVMSRETPAPTSRTGPLQLAVEHVPPAPPPSRVALATPAAGSMVRGAASVVPETATDQLPI